MSKILNQVIEDYECLYEWEIRKKEDLQRRLYNQEFLLEEQGAELKELYARIDKAISIIQNDTTLNPQRQRERLINILQGDKHD